MKKLLDKYFMPGIFVCLVCFLVASFPHAIEAAHNNYSSSYRSKINKLDKDEVEEIPIPILFGLKLNNLWSNFGDPRDGGDRTHEGLDIMAPEGAPIVSPTEAVVTKTGTGGSAGKYVYTANPGGETFIYMHLSEILVKGGDVLEPGDLIGLVGDTGNAKGGAPHLHFEIREKKAKDPFPRITEEFTLKEKISFLDDAIEQAKDEDEFIEFLIENYSGELLLAKNTGLKLPSDLLKELNKVPAISPKSTADVLSPLDLAVGSEGPMVSIVQSILILNNTGPAARTLAATGATGSFGPLTKAALMEYQAAHGISATGYFGPQTRAFMLEMAL
jgi:murein DD-endopeptidase MepM/ murein hydrolase activator NlpD